MWRVVATAWLLALTLACVVPKPRYLCDEQQRCPAGLTCLAGLCVDDPGGSPSPHDAGAVCPWEIAGTLQLPSDVVTGALDGPSRNSSTSCVASDLPGGEAIYALEVATRVRVKLFASGAESVTVAVRRACDVADADLGCSTHNGSVLMLTLDPGQYYVLVESLDPNPEQSFALRLEATLTCTYDGDCVPGQACMNGFCGACSDDAPCYEDCQDEVANEIPLTIFANTWHLIDHTVSNAGVAAYYTAEARRCQWTKLSDQCSAVNCLRSDWPDGDLPLSGHSAGTVTISNDRGSSEVFEPDQNGMYPFRPTTRWLPGDEITFRASGAEIPAYSRSILFPGDLTVTSAMVGEAGTRMAVDVNADFVATWVPFQGKVWVYFGQGTTYSNDFQDLGCLFDARAGTGTIPAAMMQRLKTDAGMQSGLGIANRVKKCFRVGEFHMQASAVNGPWVDVTLE